MMLIQLGHACLLKISWQSSTSSLRWRSLSLADGMNICTKFARELSSEGISNFRRLLEREEARCGGLWTVTKLLRAKVLHYDNNVEIHQVSTQ